jgi:hypothetical protein
MSDVVAAALIAGMVGLLGTAATVLVTRWNTTAQARQRDQAREDAAKGNRQSKYADLAWQLQRLHKYASFGRAPDKGDWEDWLDYYAFSSGVVLIVCSAQVADAVNAFTAALEEAAPDFREAVESKAGTLVPADDPWHPLITSTRRHSMLPAPRC